MDKFLFLTGSEGQIGTAISKKFKESNWKVYGMDVEKKNKNIFLNNFFRGDVTDRDDFKSFFSTKDFKSKTSHVTLINNAGVAVFSPSEERTYEEFKFVTDVNLLGPIYGITEFYKNFKKFKEKNNGLRLSVLNIASIYGISSPNNKIYTDTARNSSEIYGATKAGLIQMTKYFATRYANESIQVNCISPGGVLNESLQGKEFIENYSALVPMKRLCSETELAELTFSIVDCETTYFTGQNIIIDGGMTSW